MVIANRTLNGVSQRMANRITNDGKIINPLESPASPCPPQGAEEGNDFVPVKEDHGLFQTEIRFGFTGWQVGFHIDHQGFYLESNIHAFPEENTKLYAAWMEDNLVAALQRLVEKSNCSFLEWCYDNSYVKDEEDKLFWKAWVNKRKQTGLTPEQLYKIYKNGNIESGT